ncbi:hypothetical protein YC2023_024443 [Brassica napus]
MPETERRYTRPRRNQTLTQLTEPPSKQIVRRGKEPARKMLRESPFPGNRTGETCLRSKAFPEAKAQRKGIETIDRAPAKASSHLREERENLIDESDFIQKRGHILQVNLNKTSRIFVHYYYYHYSYVASFYSRGSLLNAAI